MHADDALAEDVSPSVWMACGSCQRRTKRVRFQCMYPMQPHGTPRRVPNDTNQETPSDARKEDNRNRVRGRRKGGEDARRERQAPKRRQEMEETCNRVPRMELIANGNWMGVAVHAIHAHVTCESQATFQLPSLATLDARLGTSSFKFLHRERY